jgi:hypothetical protein
MALDARHARRWFTGNANCLRFSPKQPTGAVWIRLGHQLFLEASLRQVASLFFAGMLSSPQDRFREIHTQAAAAAAVGGYVTVFDPLNRLGAGAGTGSGVGATTPGAPSRYTEEDEQRQVHPNLQPRSAGAGSDRGECSPVAADAELPLLLHIEPSLQEHTRNHHGDVSLTP